MKKIVVLSGAGVSAESGISTFRDSGGLWENYDVMEVASIEGWHRNPALVQQFYNDRRRQLPLVEPNKAHCLLAELEKDYQVTIVTQNVDNLHERAGSTVVIHLHGELTKVCNESKTIVHNIGYEPIRHGEKAEDGTLLRPFIVWFGEAVPMIEKATKIVGEADILIIVGTSMKVYPAAGLINFVKPGIPIYLIDPNEVAHNHRNVHFIEEKASVGMDIVCKELKDLSL